MLTGKTDPSTWKRGVCAAGHKGMYHESWSLPDADFLSRIDNRLGDLRRRGTFEKAYPANEKAGELTPEWAEKLGLKDRTLFLGGQDTVETILCKADLFLLPSASEAFGLAALEALASGVPVVASIVGGLPELVKDGEVGYLAPIADVETMARRALEILSSPDLHRTMAENARKLTVEKFDTKAIVKQYYDFYNEVLAKD